MAELNNQSVHFYKYLGLKNNYICVFYFLLDAQIQKSMNLSIHLCRSFIGFGRTKVSQGLNLQKNALNCQAISQRQRQKKGGRAETPNHYRIGRTTRGCLFILL